MDLTPLGVVSYIDFVMDTSDKGAYGMNTPTYFCIDNMKAELTDDTPIASGIESVVEKTDKVTVVGIYTLEGVKIDRIQKGVNILKMSDGSIRKFNFRR